MKEITLTKGKVTLVDDADYETLAKHKWYACKKRDSFYAYRDVGPRKGRIRIPMHREILGLLPGDGKIGDHEDQNTLNNQRYNLRVVSESLNKHNCKHRSSNTSGYRGVSRHRKGYIAQITAGEHINLGFFRDPVQAALAYDAAAMKQYGINAILNFPKEAICK